MDRTSELSPAHATDGAPRPIIELSPMSLADVDAVLPIEIQICPFPWGRANFVDSIESGYQCWVGRVNGELIGYFIVMLAVDDAHLLTIGVKGKHQGQGFGAQLLHKAMQVARNGGSTVLLLEVRPSNETALAMYRQFGFQQIGVRRAYYPAAGGREDGLVLTRSLDEVLA